MVMSLDDSQLLRLAADPRTRLFPSLRGSSVFGPIVLLAGLLPCIAAVLSSEFSDESADWALRALDASAATKIQDWLEPGRDGLGSGLIHQPPLTTWLLAQSVPRLGTQQLTNWLVISLAATTGAIWVTYLLGRRVGGSAFGLITTLVLCGHPVVLRLATGTSPAAVGLLLIALTVWGFLGHLEGPPQLVSVRMLAGAVALGLALLAVGPVAVAMLIPMLLHVWLLAGERVRAGTAGRRETRLWQIWIGMRSLVVFGVTAISFSAWWEVMMLADHGSAFWQSWWTGQAILFSTDHHADSFWRNWLSQNSLIVGWMAVGLASAIRELRFPSSEHMRRRSQFVLCWWLTAFSLRSLFELPALQKSMLMNAWDASLLLPTAVLTAWGVRTIVLRQTTLFFEAFLLVSTMGLFVWRATNRPDLGLGGFFLGFIFVALWPAIVSRIRRYSEPWKERDWRRLLRAAIVGQVVLHLAAGLFEFPRPSADSLSLVKLRQRISNIEAVPRVTLMTVSTAPESLLFVLRSHWPNSQFILAGTRDGTTVSDPLAGGETIDSTHEIVIEWTRREFRLATEFTPNRQTAAIGDYPLRFRERNLMVFRVTPREH